MGGVKTHRCASCGERKPYDQFKPVNGSGWGDDDLGIRRHSYCVPCEAKRSRASQKRSRERMKREGRSKYRNHPHVRVGAFGRDTLPVEPFAAWLRVKLREYGPVYNLADACGINERRVRSILNGEQPRVALGLVDIALTHEESTFLFELYPELYPGLDVAALSDTLAALGGRSPVSAWESYEQRMVA